MEWETIATAVLVGGVGGGGLSTFVRIFHDRHLGDRTADREDALADDAHWKSLIEAQTRALLEPLQAQVDRHTQRISELEQEIREARSRYWRAIQLTHALYEHISRHSSPDAPPAPTVPTELADDF